MTLNKLRERLKRGKGVSERDVHRWSQRGAMWPKSFADFLDERPWRSARVAELVGCSQKDAESILAIFGFAPREDNDGLWHPSGDEAANVLRLVFAEALWSRLGFSEDDAERFRARVEELLQTGERPPPPEFEELEEAELGPGEDYCSYCGQGRPRAYLAYGNTSTSAGTA
jgi:hypothetical protein